MADSTETPVLAIDGGGTRCRFALVRGKGRLVVEGGSANVSTDFDAACACLRDGLAQLSRESGMDLAAVPAFVGLAGVTGPAMVARLQDALPLRNATYADDRPTALRGALGARDGVIAHCGTGSFFAAQIGREMRFAGGWGAVLGDEASAQWVGRRALTLTLSHVDGHLPGSALTRALLSELDGAPGIVTFAADASPSDFGALAPLVTQLAAQGDPVAIQVQQDAGAILTQNLCNIGWRPGLVLCLTGGIGPHHAPYLPDDMRAAVTPPEGSPLDGAIALAQARHKEMSHGDH